MTPPIICLRACHAPGWLDKALTVRTHALQVAPIYTTLTWYDSIDSEGNVEYRDEELVGERV